MNIIEKNITNCKLTIATDRIELKLRPDVFNDPEEKQRYIQFAEHIVTAMGNDIEYTYRGHITKTVSGNLCTSICNGRHTKFNINFFMENR